MKDLTDLVETGWDKYGQSGKLSHVKVKVKIIREIHRIPPSQYYGKRNVCQAIVETDQGNFVYNFWYEHDLDSDVTTKHGEIVTNLENNLPDSISFDNLGPYTVSALATVNRYAVISNSLPFCKLRSESWGDSLRAKILSSIPLDRKELRESFESIVSHDTLVIDENWCKTLSKRKLADADMEHGRQSEAKFVHYADDIVLGLRSIWE